MMAIFTLAWLSWSVFVAGVCLSAVADTGRTWGTPQAVGLAVGLLALYVWMPLGSMFAIGASVGALTMARGERKRLGLSA